MVDKLQFHEVLSSDLTKARADIASSVVAEHAKGRLLFILDMLERSKMKTADAHALAGTHADLPSFLAAKPGAEHLAQYAQQTLDDLRGREDEKPFIE